MAHRGVSLHIAMPTTAYGGYRDLPATADDLGLLADIARRAGYAVRDRLESPSITVVRAAVEEIAAELMAGDQFLLTFAGHGPLNRSIQSWVLNDGELDDAEVFGLLTRFRPGVRVLLISDSCSSGGIAAPVGECGGPACSVISMSAAKDGTYAYSDGDFGIFSRSIGQVWAGGGFDGDHRRLFEAAAHLTQQVAQAQQPPLIQRPVFEIRGDDRADLEAFAASRPFSLAMDGI